MEIFYIFFGLTVLGLAGYVLQIWAVRLTFKNKHDDHMQINAHNDCNCYCPPISVLKPLKGLDDNLFDNLESFCKQDYPEYEIIFSLQDHNDHAYKVAKKIKDKYPDKDISIVVDSCFEGLNPKVNNLIPAYKASKYELILISDSNVMVKNNYLKSITEHMKDPNVGLVSNIIRGIGGKSIGAILENLHLNSFIVGSVCLLERFLKMPCVIGKSMLIRKSDLQAIGGFKAVKDVLAEDYVIGEKIHKMGKKVVLSNHKVNNVNEYWDIKRFLNRHTRWGKLRWRLGGAKYISELIGNPVFMSTVVMPLCEVSKITVSFAIFVSTVKVIGDLYLAKIIDSKANPMVYLLSPIKDIIIGLIWFVPIFSNIVVWRGNRYIIGKDSVLSHYPENNLWALRYRLISAIKARIA